MSDRPHQPDRTTHSADWTTGRCRTCGRAWPCVTKQVLLQCEFLDAPQSLRAHMIRTASQVDPKYRDQIMGWLGPE